MISKYLFVIYICMYCPWNEQRTANKILNSQILYFSFGQFLHNISTRDLIKL